MLLSIYFNQMRKNLFILYMAASALYCQANERSIVPTDVTVERADRNLAVGMTLDLSDLKVKSNQSVTLTPVLVSPEGERRELPAVTVAGRARYYTLQREHSDVTMSNNFYRYSKDMSPLQYTTMVPYEAWMSGSELTLEANVEGCCSSNLGQSSQNIKTLNFERPKFVAEYVFATPKAEAVKVREVEGKAYVDFKVNQTVILPDFGHNPGELAKVRQSIDAVRDNNDTKITSLTITGFASPEGSYSNNERLAKGRTEALAFYVNSLYNFPAGVLSTSWVPEDWEGVVRFLNDTPSFDNREAILAIVNSAIDPDSKNDRIMKEYPASYRYLLDNVYPALRHSDYKIEYSVRSYTTVEEIAKVFVSRPGDLSLEELFKYAESMPEGSAEYTEVYETAARLFPSSQEASLNAGVANMKRGNLEGASRYLDKAGSLPEAIYARGVNAALSGDYATARTLLEKAHSLGVSQAQGAIDSLKALEEN